jgi:hypothetical protein
VTGNVAPGVSRGSGVGIPAGRADRGCGLGVTVDALRVGEVDARRVVVLGEALVVDGSEATGVEGAAQPGISTADARTATTVYRFLTTDPTSTVPFLPRNDTTARREVGLCKVV